MPQRISRADIPRLAALLVDAGTRLGQQTIRDGRTMPVGEAAWWASLEFQPGPKAARTDPSTAGGPSLKDAEEDDERPGHSDPTGEAAISADRTAAAHAAYRALLDWLDDNASDLRSRLGELVPHQPNTEVSNCGTCGAPRPTPSKRRRDQVATEVVAEGWCKSCYKDDRYLEPIAPGQLYRHYCRWCGDFVGEHGHEPALAVLQVRHQARRVSTALVERHCPANCKTKAKPADPGQPRKKRGWRREPVS